MSEEDYAKFIKQLTADYSVCRGVMAKLRSEKKKTPIVLCVSSYRNEGQFVPTQCILWKGERSIYRGKLKRKKLFHIMNKYEICCAEITTAEDSELGDAPYICFGDRCNCSCKECRCKDDAYYANTIKRYTFVFAGDGEQQISDDVKKSLKLIRAKLTRKARKLAKGMIKRR